MNELITQNHQPMMSSLEIADLTEKRHADVIRDIWVMIEQLYNVTKDNANLRHKKNQEVTLVEGVIAIIDYRGYVSEIKLDRRHTEILISGYDVVRRAAIIDRWHALESGLVSPTAISRKQLAMMVIEAENRAEAFQLENKHLSATVESLEKHLTKGMTLTSFCKSLNGVNVHKIMQWASERNWVYNSRRDPEKKPKWRVTSYARDKYLTEEETKIKTRSLDEIIKFTPVLLEKGCHRLYQLYMKGELPMKKTWNGEFSHNKAIYTPEIK
ncbi:Rha family transcriptional regulator [Providencia stuartii]|uniref:Rha family transcriptional regulator n=1 Tax=Providencia stuartii TaxID=588 RepID=UPI0023AFAD67|nr:Rha family transcriptional regulator [Providencia thailandensis]MDE8747558.1 Rha family transcriptional regulator [Providencia thailandensis]MDE8766564.1 Rha family transcriptional regulator [Providencia thailandensis]MDE8778621.1 Rha family transcriptional regulator [Providencia thailandensis]MDE8783029.1 Rha family transcriptional regulator [Providencia thailandensis]MDE8787023.1 Rha family transcriptional regulator [Providencia thailandensis]